MTNEEKQAIYARFLAVESAALDAAQQAKLETIEFYLYHPGAQDFVRAAQMLAELGF